MDVRVGAKFLPDRAFHVGKKRSGRTIGEDLSEILFFQGVAKEILHQGHAVDRFFNKSSDFTPPDYGPSDRLGGSCGAFVESGG